MMREFYGQVIVAMALVFGASIGIADAVASAADADVPKLAADAPTDALPVVPSTQAPSAVVVESGAAVVSAAPSAAASSADTAASAAPSAAASAPSSDIVAAGATAINDVRSAVEARNIPAWLLAFSSFLWFCIAVARRFGFVDSRKAVAAVTLAAAVIGGFAAQLLLGVNVTNAFLIALGGPGAVALNEFLRAFGINPSSGPSVNPSNEA